MSTNMGICKFYIRGYCWFGNKCWFSHDLSDMGAASTICNYIIINYYNYINYYNNHY